MHPCFNTVYYRYLPLFHALDLVLTEQIFKLHYQHTLCSLLFLTDLYLLLIIEIHMT